MIVEQPFLVNLSIFIEPSLTYWPFAEPPIENLFLKKPGQKKMILLWLFPFQSTIENE